MKPMQWQETTNTHRQMDVVAYRLDQPNGTFIEIFFLYQKKFRNKSVSKTKSHITETLNLLQCPDSGTNTIIYLF